MVGSYARLERLNAEIEDGKRSIPPVETGDIVPVTDIDAESRCFLRRLKGISGRDVFLFTSRSGREDLPHGFSHRGVDYVRYEPGSAMVFHAAHEWAHGAPEIRNAGMAVAEKLHDDVLDAYLARVGRSATKEERAAMRTEFVCDMFGAFQYAAAVGHSVYDQLGMAADPITVDKFEEAFSEALAGKSLEETTDEEWARENLRAGGVALSETGMEAGRVGTHTPEMQRTIDAYVKAVDPAVLSRAEMYRNDKSAPDKWIKITKVNDRLANRIHNLTGISVTGYSVFADKTTFNHIEIRHGKNGEQDHSMSDLEDVARMGFVIDHFTRKQGLAWEYIFLPTLAPAAWQKREVLWNAVEENERTKDSRLARELVVALPVALDKEAQIVLLTKYIQNSFVADGMCADAAIHDADRLNPHAHILLTVRPLNEDGTWQHKTEKEYLCVRNGEERGFTAAEYKATKADGWEKQYLYKVGNKKVYMPPSEAAKQGYERADKHPKSTRFGRQNPISERWNSEEQLVLWREAWANAVNRALERSGLDARIDHRSHAERGLDEQPTIHEGVIARLMEREGMVSDRCELNRQIRADNKLLRGLKAQVARLVKTVQNTIPVIANALETVRENMLIFSYQLRHIRSSKRDVTQSLAAIQPDFSKYTGIVKRLTDMGKQRQALLSEKKKTPALHLAKHIELSRSVATLTEDMEELRSEKTLLLHLFEKTDDAGMVEVRQRVNDMETSLQKLAEADKRYTVELDAALTQYKALCSQAEPFDRDALAVERQAIRPAKTQDAADRLRTAYGYQYEPEHFRRAEKDVAKLLDEPERSPSIRERLRQAEKQMQRQTLPGTKHRDDKEK